ncbi:MAG: HD domain-containing protein [Bradymonadales bacterium]|jgi:(p)ppGpp synthase/HD superfamily hydrolase
MILSEKFDRAYLLAAELHREQKRKNIPTPFIAHLLAVSSIVAENTEDEDLVIAAMLHDAVEDQGGFPTLKRIREEFGERVAEIVFACTDSTEMPRPPKAERNRVYLEKLKDAPPEVHLLSCADKIHNLRCMYADFLLLGDELWRPFSSAPANIIANYQNLLLLYQEHIPESRLVRLFEEELAKLIQIYKQQT